MGRPPWRYSRVDGQLHLIRREVSNVAVALCPVQESVADWEKPGDEDQPRCAACVRIYGAELAGRGVGP